MTETFTDCSDVVTISSGRLEGVYQLRLSSGKIISTYCEKDGWTRFLRREDGSVKFNRNWYNYTNGFGNVAGEFWLGKLF